MEAFLFSFFIHILLFLSLEWETVMTFCCHKPRVLYVLSKRYSVVVLTFSSAYSVYDASYSLFTSALSTQNKPYHRQQTQWLKSGRCSWIFLVSVTVIMYVLCIHHHSDFNECHSWLLPFSIRSQMYYQERNKTAH